MKTKLLIPLASLLVINASHAAVIASYVNGTGNNFAAGNNGTTSTIATVSGLDVTG